MGHPRPVEPGLGLAVLVLADLGERALVDLGIAAARDEGRHAAHGEGATPVAGLDQQVAVGLHHRRGHRHGVAVGEGEVRPGIAEVLDDAEQVVPAARVEACRMVAQLVEDLVHLEGGRDRLDEHGGADRPVRDAELLLRVGEDVVPQPCLEVGLHLRQVDVRAAAALEELGGVVEEVEAEVDEGGHHGPALHLDVRLVEVPAPGPRNDDGYAVGVLERVVLALRGGELDGPANGVTQVDLAADDVVPVRVLASSRSASQTLAPEFRALIAILRSVGPVISTRRSAKLSGMGATVQSPARTSAVSGRKSRRPVSAIVARRLTRACSSSSRRAPNRVCRSARNSSASGVRISSLRSTGPRSR